MNDIASISNAITIAPVFSRPLAVTTTTGSSEITDQLELSDTAQILGRLPSATPARAEMIAQIRQAIQDGTYETPARIDGTVDRLMDVLNFR